MLQAMIRLASVGDVKTFVGIVRRYPFEINLQSGRYTVTGKSLREIFSLDLSGEILMQADTDESASKSELLRQLQPFMAGCSERSHSTG